MKNIFYHITKKTLKQNRTRTWLTIIGVLLSTAMITAVATFGASFRQFLIDYTIQQDGNWHVSISNLTENDLKHITDNDSVAHTTVLTSIGTAPSEDLADSFPSNPYFYIQSMPDTALEELPVSLSSGRLPQNDSELIVPDYLSHYNSELLGLSTGNSLTLDIDIGNDNTTPLTAEIKKDFTIVGTYSHFPNSGFGSGGHEVFCGSLSKSFSKILSDTHISDTENAFSAYIRFQHPKDTYQLTQNLISEFEAVSWSYHTSLLRWYGISDQSHFLPILIGLCVVLVLLIMGGSILLIYNAFSISLRERTAQFGLLSSIGATKSQLRHSVFFEAFIVSGIGIPLGLIFGIGGIGVTLHFIGESITMWIHGTACGIPLKISTVPMIVSIVTSLMTVFISAWIPSRRIRSLSPMDAVQSRSDIVICPADVRVSRLTLHLFHTEGMLAQKYYRRDRRKYCTTILSLSMSMVLFVSATLFTDYLINTGTFVLTAPEWELECNLLHSPTDDTIQQFKQILNEDNTIKETKEFRSLRPCVPIPADLISKEAANYFGLHSSADQQFYYLSASLYVFPDNVFSDYAKKHGIAPDTYLEAGSLQCVYTSNIRLFNSETDRYEDCEPIHFPKNSELTLGTLTIPSESETDSLPHLADVTSLKLTDQVEQLPDALSGYEEPLSLILPESLYRKYIDILEPFFPSYTFLLKCPEFKTTYWNLKKTLQDADLNTQADIANLAKEYETDRNLLTAIRVLTYGFLILISLISIANVFHTVSTNLMLRRREFAMLRSIGMTPSSFQKMLNYECLIYGLRSIFYGVPVSLFISFILYRILRTGADISYLFPWKAVLISTAGIFFIVFLSMFYTAGKLKKQYIIQELSLT